MALRTSKSKRVMDLCGLVKELRPQRKLFSAQWKVRLETLRDGVFFSILYSIDFYASDQTYKQVQLFKSKNIINKC